MYGGRSSGVCLKAALFVCLSISDSRTYSLKGRLRAFGLSHVGKHIHTPTTAAHQNRSYLRKPFLDLIRMRSCLVLCMDRQAAMQTSSSDRVRVHARVHAPRSVSAAAMKSQLLLAGAAAIALQFFAWESPGVANTKICGHASARL